MTILAVTGLVKEAKSVVGNNGVVAVAGGGNAKALAAKLESLHGNFTGVISIGLGGAISQNIKVGEVVIADMVLAGGDSFRCDNGWRVRLGARLIHSHIGAIVGSDNVVATVRAKAALYDKTGGLVVDMESQVAARFAASRGLPLAAVRVISDAASHGLPPAALVAMRSDGGIALGRVLTSLLRHPLQLPALIRTARGANKAFARLLRCRDLCGVGLAGPDR